MISYQCPICSDLSGIVNYKPVPTTACTAHGDAMQAILTLNLFLRNSFTVHYNLDFGWDPFRVPFHDFTGPFGCVWGPHAIYFTK